MRFHDNFKELLILFLKKFHVAIKKSEVIQNFFALPAKLPKQAANKLIRDTRKLQGLAKKN